MRVVLQRALAWPDVELAARLCSALWRFWMLRGHLSEGRMWIDATLAHQAALPPELHASVLLGGGWLARQQGDLSQAVAQLEASLAIWRTLRDSGGVALALGYLGVVAYDQSEFVRATLLHQESLRLRQGTGDQWGIAVTLTNLSEVARQQGDQERALALQTQSLALFRTIGDAVGAATALMNTGLLHSQRGEHDRARALLNESLLLWQKPGEQVYLAESLEGLAGVAAAQSEAARIGGAAAAIRTAIGAPLPQADRARYQQALDSARTQIDATTFAAAWAAGQALTLEQAIADALDE